MCCVARCAASRSTPTRPPAPADQYGARAVRQVEFHVAGMLRLTEVVGADRDRRRRDAQRHTERAPQMRARCNVFQSTSCGLEFRGPARSSRRQHVEIRRADVSGRRNQRSSTSRQRPRQVSIGVGRSSAFVIHRLNGKRQAQAFGESHLGLPGQCVADLLRIDRPNRGETVRALCRSSASARDATSRPIHKFAAPTRQERRCGTLMPPNRAHRAIRSQCGSSRDQS